MYPWTALEAQDASFTQRVQAEIIFIVLKFVLNEFSLNESNFMFLHLHRPCWAHCSESAFHCQPSKPKLYGKVRKLHPHSQFLYHIPKQLRRCIRNISVKYSGSMVQLLHRPRWLWVGKNGSIIFFFYFFYINCYKISLYSKVPENLYIREGLSESHLRV